ncbi:MAG: PKD domain-containing protein [Nanoarchaeota archaeon]|nr:PKD domain-containing protein [Nanoarchaeota archaeon]
MKKFRGGMRIVSILLILVILSLSILAEDSNPTIENSNTSSQELAAASANNTESNETISPSAEDQPPATITDTNNTETSDNNNNNNNTAVNTSTSPTPSEISVSVVANPTTGNAPLIVQFTAVATGKAPRTYSWDFNNDNLIDSTRQNPSNTFNTAGNYSVKVTATDATGESTSELVPIIVTSYDSHLSLSSYFPTEFNKGAAQITFIVSNDGTETVNNIAARIVGNGVEYLTSTTLPTLNPGDKDTVTVKVNILRSGTLEATIKILDKQFPITLDVTQQVEYDKTSMEADLAAIKQQLDEQEKIYYEKKADGYLVSEMAEQIKDLKQHVLETEQQLFTGKLPDASVGLHISKSAITDLSNDLVSATKPKVSFLQWLKENAVAIAAIIAAFGTISGLLIKAKHKAAKAAEQAGRFGKEMAKKKWFGKKGEVKDQPAATAPIEEEAEGNPLTDDEKEEK